MSRRKITTSWLVLLAAAGPFLGCSAAKVPAEAVELSAAVGQGITDMQVSHEAFVQDYFKVSRDRIEDFLQNRWIPEFLENFVRDAELMEFLDSPQALEDDDLARVREELVLVLRTGDVDNAVSAVQRALGDAERGQIILEFAQAAVLTIEAQRRELIDPINGFETSSLQHLRAAYEAVTALLKSVHDVQVEQDAILQRLGVLEARDEALRQAAGLNDSVVQILSQSGTAEETAAKIKELYEKAK
jgi:hypothetical protein